MQSTVRTRSTYLVYVDLCTYTNNYEVESCNKFPDLQQSFKICHQKHRNMQRFEISLLFWCITPKKYNESSTFFHSPIIRNWLILGHCKMYLCMCARRQVRDSKKVCSWLLQGTQPLSRADNAGKFEITPDKQRTLSCPNIPSHAEITRGKEGVDKSSLSVETDIVIWFHLFYSHHSSTLHSFAVHLLEMTWDHSR